MYVVWDGGATQGKPFQRVYWPEHSHGCLYHASVETEVFYLPRSVEATELPAPPNLNLAAAPKESHYDWRVSDLAVNRTTEGKQVSSEIAARVSCYIQMLCLVIDVCIRLLIQPHLYRETAKLYRLQLMSHPRYIL